LAFGEHGVCEGNMMSNEACIGLEFGRWVRLVFLEAGFWIPF
jgi:hypothetical protein